METPDKLPVKQLSDRLLITYESARKSDEALTEINYFARNKIWIASRFVLPEAAEFSTYLYLTDRLTEGMRKSTSANTLFEQEAI